MAGPYCTLLLADDGAGGAPRRKAASVHMDGDLDPLPGHRYLDFAERRRAQEYGCVVGEPEVFERDAE